MIIDPAELERRLKSNKNLVNTLKLPDATASGSAPASPGPDPNSRQEKAEPPIQAKKLAASLVMQGVSPNEVADLLDLSPKEIRKAQKNPEVRSSVEHTQERVRELALDKLMLALGLMTEDKFEGADLKQLSNTVSALSKVAGATAPQDSNKAPIQLVIYAPEQRKASQFKVIDV